MELTSTDYLFMTSFIKIVDKWLSSLGRELKRRVQSQLDSAKRSNHAHYKLNYAILWMVKFHAVICFSQCNKLYLNNELRYRKFKVHENLVTLLLKALVMKMMGQKNARYS